MDNTSASAAAYASISDLAVRWGVSAATARNTTLAPTFPAPLSLGGRTLRWLVEEVLAWELAERTRAQRRRVMTGLPQHRVQRTAPGPILRTRRVSA